MAALLVLMGVFCLGTFFIVTAGLVVLVLIKLGVITHYALKEEPVDTSSYELEQSQEAGEK